MINRVYLQVASDLNVKVEELNTFKDALSHQLADIRAKLAKGLLLSIHLPIYNYFSFSELEDSRKLQILIDSSRWSFHTLLENVYKYEQI